MHSFSSRVEPNSRVSYVVVYVRVTCMLAVCSAKAIGSSAQTDGRAGSYSWAGSTRFPMPGAAGRCVRGTFQTMQQVYSSDPLRGSPHNKVKKERKPCIMHGSHPDPGMHAWRMKGPEVAAEQRFDMLAQ